ncbi:MAG: 2-oxo acid dehydrogenase subunit E2 [Bdellovibrionales bacterium]|jgi:pyruvate dehydrogenase E2 component (dihydrolipoamide acetyltransferase)|nr:2-oxo acid dehydrogenase subunit E2 [Bdellovibrionales bacterium]
MARQQIVMPKMGESITTGTITKWNKNIGDEILEDEILLDISTDKVESEIPSPFAGKVAALLFEEGDTVDVGHVIAEIEDDLTADIKESATTKPLEEKKVEVEQAPVVEVAVKENNRKFFTPLVKAMAKSNNISLGELTKIPGTGIAGRVNKQDFEKYLKNSKSTPTKTGTNIIPMDNMRKAIANNMVKSKLTSPHVNSIAEVDLTHIVKFRESFKNEFLQQEGFKLTYTPFLIYSLIQTLKEFPYINASVDGDNIVIKNEINLGFAVAVPGNGLVVPVVKNADGLNLLGLSRELNTLIVKARDKKLTMKDLSDGTFTFTNVGTFGTLLATPIILQPQVGIYAAGAIQKRVVVKQDDSLAIRSMMYGTHTYDHRLVDGEMGGMFLYKLHDYLEKLNPETLF